MADKKDEKPRHEKDYETFKKEHKLVQKTRDTMQLYHNDVMTSAIKKHLLDDGGEIDYNRLKTKSYQTLLADEMTKGYDKYISEYYKTDLKSLPKNRKELVRKNLMGVNSSFLNNTIEQLQDKFTIDAYTNEVIDKHLEQVVQTLAEGTYAHINPEDIPKLLKLAKLDDKFDEKMIDQLKDPQFKSKIGSLLYTNHATKGKFKDDVYDKLGLAPYMKKAE
jgi:hypothetical protein